MFNKQFESIHSEINQVKNEVMSKVQEKNSRFDDIELKFKEFELSIEKKLTEQHIVVDQKLGNLERVTSSLNLQGSQGEVMFGKLEEKMFKEFKELREMLTKDNKEFKDEYMAILKKHDINLADLSLAFDRLKVEVDQKLIKNNQEYGNKLFEILSSFLRWNKEISLVSFLGGKEPDLKKLKLELERPMVEEGWAKTNAEQADKINRALSSKGEKVRQAWEKYKEEKLKLEREGRDTKLVSSKLEILDVLMEGANNV